MSFVYKVAEKGCFLLNKLPGGGPKRNMSELISDNEKIKLPGNKYSGLDIKEEIYEGFTVHRMRAQKSRSISGKAVLFLPGGGGMARATSE